MKRIWPSVCVAITCLSMQGFAGERTQKMPAKKTIEKNAIEPLIEVKAGYFIFANEKMRKIYHEGGLDLQLSGSYPVWRWLQIYGSLEYLTRQGNSLNGKQKTRIWEVPVSIGLKPVYAIRKNIHFYGTIGPRYVYIHQHNNSAFVDREINKSTLGGFLNTGFNFLPYDHFLIDLFAEYSFVQIHCHPSKTAVSGRSIQVGGFVFGAGLGYAF